MHYGALERFTADDGELRIDFVIQPAISYCCISSDLPIVRRLAVTNLGAKPIAGLRLALDLTSGAGPIAPPWVVTLSAPLPQGSTVDWEDFGSFAPTSDQLRDVDESFEVDYRVVASCADRPTLRLVAPSLVLAHNEWFNSPALYDSLAAFVQPGSHAVGTVLRSAAGLLLNRTGSPALQGYQAGPHRAAQIAGAIYEGLRGAGLRQQTSPAGEFQGHAHRVRTTSAVLNRRLGTCLDLAVAYASCCEAAGLRPLIWLTRDRAFAGFLLEERHLGASVITETNALMSMVDSGLAVPVELSSISNQADFTSAVASGLEHFHTTDVCGVIDIHLAHRSGVQPIAPKDRPLSGEMPTSVITPVIQTTDGDAGSIELPTGVASARLHQHSEEGDDAPAIPDTAPPRVQRWKKALLDLSLRNPLLNLPTGSGVKGVDLLVPPGALAILDDLIHDGGHIQVVPTAQAPRDEDSSPAPTPAALLAALANERRVHATVPQQRYVATMRALQRDAHTMQQETGGNYLYVTLGTLIHPKTTGGDASAPLFLLPVRIEGGTGGASYSLVIDGSEIAAPNHCLVEWLRVKHGVRIPQLENPAHDEHGIDIPQALAAIASGLTEHHLGYRVEESASLRLLQFPSFQIWRDLTDHWATFMENPVVRHLVTAGGSSFGDPAGDNHHPIVDEADLHLPIPADGSQMRAVMMAERGQSFVLEGPPGTGKSQTITNLIARCLASGRTVLFVAEKEAALDVVKNRLAATGLAPFALNLHGRKQSMNAIRQQLLEALAQSDRSDDATWATTETTYRSLLSPLTTYPGHLHRTNAVHLSAWSAYATLLTHGDGPIAPIPPEYLTCPDERRTRVEVALRELPMAARSAGLRSNHAWSCSGRRTLAGLNAGVLLGVASNLEGLRTRVVARPGLITLLRGLVDPFDLAGMLPAVQLAARGALSMGAPASPSARAGTTRQEPGVRYEATPDWDRSASAVEADLTMFHQNFASEIHAFRPELYDRVPLDTWYEEAQDAAARLFGRGKRLQAIADRLSAYLTIPTSLEPDSVERLLARLLALRSHETALAQRVRDLGYLSLPPDWRPISREAVAQLSEARNASVISGKLHFEHPTTWSLLDGGVTLQDAELLEQLSGAWGSWSKELQIGELELRRWAGKLHWYDAWQRDGKQWLADLSSQELAPIGRWGMVLSQVEALTEAGLVEFRDQLLSADLPMPEADPAYRRGIAQAALTERLRAEGLEYFDAEEQDARISQLASASEELRTGLVTRLPAMVLRRRGFTAEDARGRVAEVVAELHRKRGGKSFRELFSMYSDVILAITPCVLVSPASAATFLAPDATRFDLVVFDEASQIRVAEAIGPMGRGKSTVVVGDSQQMPPSSVMRTSPGLGSEFDLWQNGDGAVEDLPEDLDSILTEVVDAQLPQCWLSWHYRSCDESLIAFSNHHFYEDKLSSLPSPEPVIGQAISWQRVQGVFDRGRTRTNEVEARAVVDDIVRRVTHRTTSGQSIGVVTFNIQQRDLILNLLEECPSAAVQKRLLPTSDEPLFVKNLENVQGDERDVILFSLAFSTDQRTGHLPLNFGPLSQFGGERRLNVAITRARREVSLFASFDPQDIDLARTTAVGTRRLRQYCELAADPPKRLAELVASRDARDGSRDRPADDPIRDEIASAIRALGYEVATGHGLSTFTVDVAVRVPGSPQWQVAILLDGPVWSQRMTVADRDLAPRLLSSVMGWPAVLRCWLPSWVSDRQTFLGQLTQTLTSLPIDVPPKGEKSRGRTRQPTR